MSFADMLKKGSLRQFATATVATVATVDPQTHPSVATVATVSVATAQKQAANDPVKILALVSTCKVSTLVSSPAAVIDDPDRWCWPHSTAMTGREIDTMAGRTALFHWRGLAAIDAELLADKLVNRDRDADDRRLCLECAHLSGRAGAMRCAQWQQAGLGASGVPVSLPLALQRCDGFKAAT